MNYVLGLNHNLNIPLPVRFPSNHRPWASNRYKSTTLGMAMLTRMNKPVPFTGAFFAKVRNHQKGTLLRLLRTLSKDVQGKFHFSAPLRAEQRPCAMILCLNPNYAARVLLATDSRLTRIGVSKLKNIHNLGNPCRRCFKC